MFFFPMFFTVRGLSVCFALVLLRQWLYSRSSWGTTWQAWAWLTWGIGRNKTQHTVLSDLSYLQSYLSVWAVQHCWIVAAMRQPNNRNVTIQQGWWSKHVVSTNPAIAMQSSATSELWPKIQLRTKQLFFPSFCSAWTSWPQDGTLGSIDH